MHTSLRPTVLLLVSIALVACSQPNAPTAENREATAVLLSKTSVDIPYIVNAAEVAGAATIVTSAQVKPTDPSNVGTVKGYLPTEERSVLLSTLRNSDQEMIALDVLVGEVKQNLSFNAESSAKADIMFTLGLFNVPNASMVEAYGRIESHDLFPQFVQLHREAQRYADTDEAAALSVSIAVDIKADLLQQEEQMPSESFDQSLPVSKGEKT